MSSNCVFHQDLCLMKHLSDGESSIVNNRHTKNETLGIFQINSRACGWTNPAGLCMTQCKSSWSETKTANKMISFIGFTDDAICDDLRCAMKMKERNGFGYWSAYKKCDPNANGYQVLPKLNDLRCFDDNANAFLFAKPRFCK